MLRIVSSWAPPKMGSLSPPVLVMSKRQTELWYGNVGCRVAGGHHNEPVHGGSPHQLGTMARPHLAKVRADKNGGRRKRQYRHPGGPYLLRSGCRCPSSRRVVETYRGAGQRGFRRKSERSIRTVDQEAACLHDSRWRRLFFRVA